MTTPQPPPPFHPPVFDDAFRARLVELFQWRRDVRSFRPDPVPEAVLDRLFAMAALAPSVGLSQPWRFVRVDDPVRRAAIVALFKAANAEALAVQEASRAGLYARLKLAGLEEAPFHLAVCCEPDPAQGHGLGRRTMPSTAAWSAVLAIHTLWLAARAEGLGVGWVSILDPVAVVAALDLPVAWQLVGYLCIGLPAAESAVPELERAGWERRQPPGIVRR